MKYVEPNSATIHNLVLEVNGTCIRLKHYKPYTHAGPGVRTEDVKLALERLYAKSPVHQRQTKALGVTK